MPNYFWLIRDFNPRIKSWGRLDGKRKAQLEKLYRANSLPDTNQEGVGRAIGQMETSMENTSRVVLRINSWLCNGQQH